MLIFVGIYLTIGFALGYFILGLENFFGEKQYWHPLEIIKGWYEIMVLAIAMCLWFPILLVIVFRRHKQ